MLWLMVMLSLEVFRFGVKVYIFMLVGVLFMLMVGKVFGVIEWMLDGLL